MGDELASGYQRLKPAVLRRARRWFPTLSDVDLEDAYQAAWLSVVRTEAEVRDVDDYVYAAMRSQGLMELRRRRRRPVVGLPEVGNGRGDEAEEELVDQATASPDERAEMVVMAEWARDLLEELSVRQRSVVTLRWGWGLSRREISGLLGVSEKAVKRDLEVAGRRLAEVVAELRAGRWCERRRSVVTAYAFGLLSRTRTARAEAHLRACPGCRELVRQLRRHAQDLAAVAPPPLVADLAHGRLDALTGTLEGLRAQLSEWVSSAKAHAVTLSVRATDPTPLAGARPTTVAAAVAGCLAVGSGAYCAVEGAVPEPLRIGPLAQQPAEAKQPDQSRTPDPPTQTGPVSPVALPPQTEAPEPESAVPPPPVPPEPAPEPEPTQDFFGSEPASSPASNAAVAATAQAAEAASKPAPAASRGEFGGP